MKIYNEYNAEKFLSKYLKINTSILTKNINEALEFSKKYDFPLGLKIISDQALHKSSINGVRRVNNKEEIVKNYNELLKISKQKKLKLEGILVHTWIVGKEIIIGVKKDNTFGHIILFGGGGIFTEILKDFSLRILPINENDALEMIKETKIYGIIKDEKNFKQIINCLLKINDIVLKHQNIIELDINPLIINEKNVLVVDARMLMG
jgi:acetyltransferase